jgi:hypothetical protein
MYSDRQSSGRGDGGEALEFCDGLANIRLRAGIEKVDDFLEQPLDFTDALVHEGAFLRWASSR